MRMVRMRVYKDRKRFKRDCNVEKGGCGKRFRPSGRYAELCEDCWKKKRSARGIRVEKIIHKAWAERKEAVKKGAKIRRLVGKWQYIYRSKKGEVSLIQILPAMDRKFIWELGYYPGKDIADGEGDMEIERFSTKKEAYERVREILE